MALQPSGGQAEAGGGSQVSLKATAVDRHPRFMASDAISCPAWTQEENSPGTRADGNENP